MNPEDIVLILSQTELVLGIRAENFSMEHIKKQIWVGNLTLVEMGTIAIPFFTAKFDGKNLVISGGYLNEEVFYKVK